VKTAWDKTEGPTKIDLDEIERVVRAATQGEWSAHVLALIARIRELESACRLLEESARYGIDSDSKLEPFYRAIEILAKGAVLP